MGYLVDRPPRQSGCPSVPWVIPSRDAPSSANDQTNQVRETTDPRLAADRGGPGVSSAGIHVVPSPLYRPSIIPPRL